MKISNKTILIIGGTGSLGNQLIQTYLQTNEIHVYSRDECKHWNMTLLYGNLNLKFHIGDIRDYEKIRQTLLRVNPHIVICAAALKHIDRCEFESNECIDTNIKGTQNVLNAIEEIHHMIHDRFALESFCFVSTDKACSPVNLYGMCKAVSECLVVEKARYIPSIKFVTVRYGNVLNSRGSIIPTLHSIGKDPTKEHFQLTHPDMTRFVMTLEQSVKLIEHAILHGKSGEIVIPELVSCRIIDLLEIFAEEYNKPIVLGKLRPGEKLLESLINETQSARLRTDEHNYSYIQMCDHTESNQTLELIKDYNSKLNPISKLELFQLLNKLNFLK